jgi:tetratricopeptide (TPR) repeat protein
MTLRPSLIALLLCSAQTASLADPRDPEATNTLVLGANEYLTAGADAIRAGQYDDGIRYTLLGLERRVNGQRNRAAGLANLCAAYVAKSEPGKALPYCNDSLSLDASNWRAYSNRSQAYLIMGRYADAERDNDAAAALNPTAAHVRMIRELLNERLLQPRVIMEEHH